MPTCLIYATSTADLEGILQLQGENLLPTLSQEEKESQGFVTVAHNLEQLAAMQAIAQHVVAKEGERVVGYVLAMTQASRNLVPNLIPLFEQFDLLLVHEKKVADHNFMVVGQVCIDKSHRGTGLFNQLYAAYRETYSASYDFAITSIALSNHRSMAAHQRIGFRVIHTFEDSLHPWSIVYWDWNSSVQEPLKK